MQATGVVGMGLLEGHGTTNACSLPENSAHFVRPSMRDFYLKPTFDPSPNNFGFARTGGNWGESGGYNIIVSMVDSLYPWSYLLRSCSAAAESDIQTCY